PAITIPESYGGLGLGYYELCVAAEEIGRALAPTPVAGSIFLAVEALLLAGSETQKERWLPGLATGERMAAFSDRCLGEDRLTFAAGKLDGRTGPAWDATEAHAAVVLADAPDGDPVLVLVDLDQAGVSRRTLATVDPSRDACELSFHAASAEPLGASGRGRE